MSAIDPGMEEPVKEASRDVQGDVSGDARHRRDGEGGDGDGDWDGDEDDFKYPSTWWFASTACPLLAGTFGPIASGFNVCALVYNWRVYIPPGASESSGAVRIADPRWLVAVNAVSLFSAVVGNAALLLNMARRLSFPVAQPITISGFLLGGAMLVADVAAINASPTYFITEPRAVPDDAHALTSAYYYAIWAAAIYVIIGLLMCVTVYGANNGYYDREFKLTAPQRTLMLQTMSFMAYLLLGALVFSHIEGWEYLDAVYWADVTLFVVGLGDFSPSTNVGRGLLFPFAIGGVLIVGLVIGSIRSLVLERGKKKMSARITEKRRETAIDNVDVRHQTIKVSWFARAKFSTNPHLSSAQRREEEFKIMRKLQRAAERERRYFALFMSSSFAFALWFVGAAIFQVCERSQQWTYLDALYFSFTSLITLGYGDLAPVSTAGRSFFVIWSLLAVPSLTILISNMGDTIIKWFSDFTIWVGSLTVLPNEEGIHQSFTRVIRVSSQTVKQAISHFTPPGVFGDAPRTGDADDSLRISSSEHQIRVLDHMSERLESHIEEAELDEARAAEIAGDLVQRDIHFYHYVLVRELRNVQRDLRASPSKKYTWTEWEYFLKLIGNGGDRGHFPGQRFSDILVPGPLQTSEPIGYTGARHQSQTRPSDQTSSKNTGLFAANHRSINPTSDTGVARSHHFGTKQRLKSGSARDFDLDQWSWLSDKSPLMGSRSEAEWIFERLSAALERELNRQRKGHKRQPPISVRDVTRWRRRKSTVNVDDSRTASESEVAEHKHTSDEKTATDTRYRDEV